MGCGKAIQHGSRPLILDSGACAPQFCKVLDSLLVYPFLESRVHYVFLRASNETRVYRVFSEPQSLRWLTFLLPPISSLLNSMPESVKEGPTVRRHVYINHKTTLSVLYTYEDVNAWVEYPETNADRPVGYLFRGDPSSWENPVRNFAYSLGGPSGRSRKGEEVQHPLLVDKDGNMVSCVVAHLTCM